MTLSVLRNIIIILLWFTVSSYSQESYPERTGDIEFDPDLDKSDFHLCFSQYIYQYFNTSKGLEYKGEKIALEEEVNAKYVPVNIKGESGLIRIRFIVNCKGETDRFRLISMDSDYKPKTFDKSITSQLIEISKNLKGWKPKLYKEEYPIDYYQYLIFKLKDGHIIQILP